MSAPIPTPATLAQRFAAALAQQQFTASDGSLVTLDATAPATLESALAILSGLSDYEVYLYLRDQLLELMVTTATENGLLPQHAVIWRTPRNGATAAVGNFIVSSTANSAVTLPNRTLITVDGSVQWSVTVATTIAAGASASVPVQATVTGTVGNLAANTSGTLVSPVAGISSVVSDQDGLAGGGNIEGVESWRERIIAAIRTPPGAGTKADYLRWLTAAGAGVSNIVPAYDGPGTVGLIVLMSGYVVPTTSQIASLQAAIDAERPVRGNATVYPGALVPQSPQIKLNPDTMAARTAVAAALGPYYLGLGLGGTIYVEAIQAVISGAAGSANTLVFPTQDQTLAPDQIASLGTIFWRES